MSVNTGMLFTVLKGPMVFIFTKQKKNNFFCFYGCGDLEGANLAVLKDPSWSLGDHLIKSRSSACKAGALTLLYSLWPGD